MAGESVMKYRRNEKPAWRRKPSSSSGMAQCENNMAKLSVMAKHQWHGVISANGGVKARKQRMAASEISKAAKAIISSIIVRRLMHQHQRNGISSNVSAYNNNMQ